MVLLLNVGYENIVNMFITGGDSYEVDWGDGTVNSDEYHEYEEFGIYEVKIYGGGGGAFQALYVDFLEEVVSFGTYGIAEYGFWDCYNLKKVYGAPHASTSRLVFSSCSSLTDISALAGWDTSSVTSMNSMFYGCTSLTDISALAGWDTGSVTDMTFMFRDCSSLTDISALSGWDTSSVTDMNFMFYGCTSLTTGDLSGWCVSNIPAEPSNFRTGADNWNGPFPVWGTCPPPKPSYYGPNMLEAVDPNWVCGKAPNALEAGEPNSLKAGTPNLLVSQGPNLLGAAPPNTLLAHVPNDLKAPEPNTLEATEPNLVVPQGFAVLRG